MLEIDLDEGRERGFNKVMVPESSVLIVGDAIALPFQTASFDYVYASHVLEHVDSPELTCKEIMRVGSAGYIETPSPFLEQGVSLRDIASSADWIHKWFVFSLAEDMLVFEPKTCAEVTQFCSCLDGQFMQEFYAFVDMRIAQHYFRRRAKTTILYWRSSFQVEVRDRTADCKRDRRLCRFRGMRRALLANCNDLFRATRLLRFRKIFPGCTTVFRKHGHRTVFVR